MNRRGFFGALAGGLASAIGMRAFAGSRLAAAGIGSTRIPVWPPRMSASTAGALALLEGQGAEVSPLPLPGIAPWRPRLQAVTDRPELAPAETPAHPAPFAAELQALPPDVLPPDLDAATCRESRATTAATPDVPQLAPSDLPSPGPAYTAIISGTACLPPLLRFNHLVALFGESGDDAPAFAAALIGELVVTQLRLDDLRTIHMLRRDAP